MSAGSILFKLLITATLLVGSFTLALEAILARRSRAAGTQRRPTRPRPSFWARLNHAVRVLAGPDRPYVRGVGLPPRTPRDETASGDRLYKSEAEWKAQLTEAQFNVTRGGATERPFTGEYFDHDAEGTYVCVCCGNELFTSAAKYDAGTGWPSFWRPARPDAVAQIKDISYGMVRTGLRCNRCEAHLGHLFPDGPAPTGLRYCLNSTALDFIAARDAVQRRVD